MKRTVNEILQIENARKSGQLFSNPLSFKVQFAINKTILKFTRSIDYKASIEVLKSKGFGSLDTEEKIKKYQANKDVIAAGTKIIEIKPHTVNLSELDSYDFTAFESELLMDLVDENDAIRPTKPPKED